MAFKNDYLIVFGSFPLHKIDRTATNMIIDLSYVTFQEKLPKHSLVP